MANTWDLGSVFLFSRRFGVSAFFPIFACRPVFHSMPGSLARKTQNGPECVAQMVGQNNTYIGMLHAPTFDLLEFSESFLRRIRAPIKIKSALSPPPPKTPPQNAEFYGPGFSCRKNAFFPGVHKIGAAIAGPRIADTNFTDTRIFRGFRGLQEDKGNIILRLFVRR